EQHRAAPHVLVDVLHRLVPGKAEVAATVVVQRAAPVLDQLRERLFRGVERGLRIVDSLALPLQVGLVVSQEQERATDHGRRGEDRAADQQRSAVVPGWGGRERLLARGVRAGVTPGGRWERRGWRWERPGGRWERRG